MRWLWLILAILCLLALILFFLLRKRPEPKRPEGAPILASYCYGGGMVNESERIEYKWNDGKPEIVYTRQEGAKTKNITRKVDESCGAALLGLFDFYGIASWKSEEPEEFALDASSESICFWFEDGTSYSFNTEDILPSNAWEAIRSLRLCLLEFARLEQK